MAYCCLFLFGKIIQRVVFGDLRASELQVSLKVGQFVAASNKHIFHGLIGFYLLQRKTIIDAVVLIMQMYQKANVACHYCFTLCAIILSCYSCGEI